MKQLFKQTAMDVASAGSLGGAMSRGKDALKQTAKGQAMGGGGVSSLQPLALAIVSIAIVVGIGVIVLAEMDTAVNNSDASTVLTTAIDAMQTFADFFVVIVIVGIAAVLFLLLRVVRRSASA